MEENTNQVQEQQATETDEKTFSQDDVNRIVGERLAKEKAKNESDWQQREQQLQQRELQLSAKEMLSEKGLSVELLEAINCTDQATLEKSVSIIEKIIHEQKQEERSTQAIEAKPYFVAPTGNSVDSDSLDLRRAMRLP